MIYIVEISDTDDREVLKPTLEDILSCLPSEKKDLENIFKWRIFFLEAVGKIKKKKSILSFSEEINSSLNGLGTTYKFLNEISKNLDQIIEIFFVANSGKEEIIHQKSDEIFYELYDYTFELSDSSYWVISCKDRKYVDTLQRKFSDVFVRELIKST